MNDLANEQAKERLENLVNNEDVQSMLLRTDIEAVKYAISVLSESKTQMIDKSNFDEEQHKADLQSAYDCGYKNAFEEMKMKVGGENKLMLGSGATPFTVADAVIRECPDKEWLEDVVFFLNAYIGRTYKSEDKGVSE